MNKRLLTWDEYEKQIDWEKIARDGGFSYYARSIEHDIDCCCPSCLVFFAVKNRFDRTVEWPKYGSFGDELVGKAKAKIVSISREEV